MHATTGVDLPVSELRLASRARHSQDRNGPERVEGCDDEGCLEVACRSCMSRLMVPARSIVPKLSTVRCRTVLPFSPWRARALIVP
jgi:hypothetical protein